MMESSVNAGMCRCCASEGAFKDIKSTYHWMGEEEVYADMLRECFDIILNASEQAQDGGICEVCITQLRNAINFKKQVLHTEDQFQKHLQNKTLFRPNIVKVEVQAGDDSDDNVGSGDEGFSGPEFEVPIKTEVDDPKPKKRAAAKASATTTRASAKKAKADNGETSTKRDNKPKKPPEPKHNPTAKKSAINVSLKAKMAVREEFEKHQNNTQTIIMFSNATPFLQKLDTGYVCCYCNDQYHNPADLKKHNQEIHGDKYNPVTAHVIKNSRKTEFCVKLDITGLQCKLCSSDMSSLEQLVDHLQNEHKKKLFTEIKNKILPFKFENDDIRCCICSNIFEKFRKLQEHMHTHYRNYICEQCDIGFVTLTSLRSHSEKHKLGVFNCKFCPKIFDTLRKKQSHEKAVHVLGYLVSKCGYCSERFTSTKNKDEHLAKVHGVQIRALKCQACDKTFQNKRALTIHTKRDHLMERKHKCSQCEMRFFNSSSLKMHSTKHSGLKAFQCDVCHKAYAQKKTLTQHMRIHLDDRRFKCKHCGQAFVQKCSWKAHMKNRHGENLQ